ncbi:hypothetical protein GQ44DRAFT_726384 [Phaeosphaeriaceae sp. PMI808]|nr:hypothetical protein GQ44DRAFT_726384 [Phaeosphaeriaceae sp. PMI808]
MTMASSATRKPRIPRKGNVPHNFMLKWQSSGPRPLIRRPMTACQMCRIAKVKCSGQQECDRCTSRGHVCTYTKDTSGKPTQSNASPQTSIISREPDTESILEETFIALDTTDATNHSSSENTVYGNNATVDNMLNWVPEQTLNDFEWAGMDSNHNHFESLYTFLSPSELELQLLPNQSHQGIATPNSPFPPDYEDATLGNSNNIFTQSSPLLSFSECQCREGLTALLPRVNRAIHERHLNDVFRGTQNIVDAFQNAVDCSDCGITYVDLISVVGAFKQTNACFEYLAKADKASVINMSFGGSEVPTNDPKLRAMLIISLIHRATAVLDAIRFKGQHMIRLLCSRSPLAQANISYLESVINDFRFFLNSMADLAEKATLQS